MDNIIEFNHNTMGKLRIIMINKIPYFVGRDILRLIGKKTNSIGVLKRQLEDKLVLKVPIKDSAGRLQDTIVINEKDLFNFIDKMKQVNTLLNDSVGLRLGIAEKWLRDEVIPSLKQNKAIQNIKGKEEEDNKPSSDTATNKEEEKQLITMQIPKTLEEALIIIGKYQLQIEQLQLKNREQALKLNEDKHKVEYYDTVLNNEDLISTTAIAKDYGWNAKILNKYLKNKHIQYKAKDLWLLYQKYADKGYTGTKTKIYQDIYGEEHTVMLTHWTQKGRQFIYDLLKKDGILPLIERSKDYERATNTSNTLE